MARVSRMENRGTWICERRSATSWGMRAGRRLSDLLTPRMGVLFILILFLSGTAVHIIKAVAQLEIMSLGVSVIAFIATLLLSLNTHFLPGCLALRLVGPDTEDGFVYGVNHAYILSGTSTWAGQVPR